MEKAPSSKRPRYDAVFRAETLRLASGSRSALAAARALNINAELLYQWQKGAAALARRRPPRYSLAGAGAATGAGAGHVKRSRRYLTHSPWLREHASVL